MDYDYTVSEDDMENDQSANLTDPYIGPAELVDLKFDDDPETFGDNDVLVFTFEAQDEDHIGQQFEHIEWEPSEQDFENEDNNGNSDFELQMRRLVHILKRVLDTDEESVRKKVVKFQGDTLSEAWSGLAKRVVQAYQKYGTTDDVVHIKVYLDTNEYDGNIYPQMKFGKYPGFVRVVGEDPKLEFNNYEKNLNQESQNKLNADPDDTDEFEDEDDFDYDVGDDTDF